MNHVFQLGIQDALAKLPGPDPDNRHYEILFQRGTAELLVYAPKGTDEQEIHDRDEFYFITQGSGKFFDGEKVTEVGAGCALFVAAGVEHRFLDFSDDLSMWVVFYGPVGGERGTTSP
ncbi:cupin domain-containing protein [Pseudorhodoferax sp.]|uniref:cupin domain-containing protein n=1 Tax=Pseudorhodoferax sp. TaxID=1993553 RepID=UPI002DD6B63C|nr:cupin domain-containing protein [Pseudorhodoferax sp.]